MSSTRTSTPNRTRRTRTAAAAALAVLLGVSIAACSDGGSDKAKAKDDSSTTTAPAASSTTVAPAADNTGGQSGNGNGNTNTGNSGGGNSGGGQSSPNPVINSFSTPDNIDCHNGNLQNFTASWSTTNATKVTISIDGPGIYDTYPANGSTSLPFNCSSSHSFLLTAYGANGHTATRSVTLQPRNVQTQGSGDDQDQP
jgi:hypothetical protein